MYLMQLVLRLSINFPYSLTSGCWGFIDLVGQVHCTIQIFLIAQLNLIYVSCDLRFVGNEDKVLSMCVWRKPRI